MNDENAVHFPDILILGSENRGLCPHAPTFFSCLDTRKEGKRKSRPLPRPRKLAGYMMEIENMMRFAHLPSLGCRPVGRMQYAPTLTVEKLSRLNLAT